LHKAPIVTINLLKNHPECIQRLAEIWQEVLGSKWLPDISVEAVVQRFQTHLNDEVLPLTLIALDGTQPIGMCSLRENDGIRPDLKPYLGSLVVAPAYQKQGVGRALIDATKKQAKSLGFQKLYLFAFDPAIPPYYERLGWQIIGMDEFKDHPVTVMESVL